MKLRHWRFNVGPGREADVQNIVATLERCTTSSACNVTGDLSMFGSAFSLTLSDANVSVQRIITESDMRTDLVYKLSRIWGDYLQKASGKQIEELFKSVGPSTIVFTVIERLNAMVKADPQVMHALVEHRLPCDEKIKTDSPAVPTQGSMLSLGMLGVINGLIPTDYRIVAEFDDTTGKLTRFSHRSAEEFENR